MDAFKSNDLSENLWYFASMENPSPPPPNVNIGMHNLCIFIFLLTSLFCILSSPFGAGYLENLITGMHFYHKIKTYKLENIQVSKLQYILKKKN